MSATRAGFVLAGFPMIADVVEGGSLGGICKALRHGPADGNLIVACDAIHHKLLKTQDFACDIGTQWEIR